VAYRQPQPHPGQADQLAALENQVQALSGEVKQLEARPPGEPAKLAALAQQVDVLAHAKPQAPPPPDLGPIEQRLSALEQRPTPDLRPLEQRLSALEQKVANLSASAASANSPGPSQEVAALSQRMNSLSQQVAPLTERVASLSQQVAPLSQRLDDLSQKLAPLGDQLQKLAQQQQNLASQVQSLKSAQPDTTPLAHRIDAQAAAIADLRAAIQKAVETAARAEQQARIDAALAALDAGRPLGQIPNAPPAAARFADQAPPTLAELRAQFPEVAQQALKLSQPSTVNKPFLDRVWSNAQDLVTVRQGDQVIVGDPASGIIARARSDLDRGDLQGAVDALSALNGPAAKAVSSWVAAAKSVLQARAALLGMARPA
jgi:hypothetical protein